MNVVGEVVMNKEALQVCEWRIENFSRWNTEVHGHDIYSPQFALRCATQMRLIHNAYDQKYQLAVYITLTSTVQSSGGNLSFIDSDGSILCTKRTHLYNWKQYVYSGLTFQEIVAKIKKKGEDRLTIRLCFLSEKSHSIAVSTTLDILNLSLKIDSKSIESLESDDSKNISIIRYNEKNPLDELLLKAIRKDETVEFVLELLTKSRNAISVESQWCLQSSGKNFVKKEEKEHVFCYCEKWTFSNSLMSEFAQNGITMLLSLKIIKGDVIHNKLNAPSEITIVPKETVCFFDQSFIQSMDSVTSKKTVDSMTALSKDLMCVYQDQDFSDFQLKCHDVTFRVHKVILSARSPVFKTMLSTDMKETASGEVNVVDLDPSMLNLFLTYLYTGAVEDLQYDRALNLYYAAEKYQVPSLKRECADYLSENVSIGNVCDILSFADKHEDDELTAVSYNFVVNNYSEVLESREWASFMDSDPKLALKTLTQIGLKKRVGKIQ